MPSTKRSRSSISTQEIRRTSRSRKKREVMNVSGFTSNAQKKSYKFDQRRESRLENECQFTSTGRELWNVSLSYPKEHQFLGKFLPKEGDWGFYRNSIGTTKEVKSKGTRLVHYAIGYEELGRMVIKYGKDINNWPVLGDTDVNVLVDQSSQDESSATETRTTNNSGPGVTKGTQAMAAADDEEDAAIVENHSEAPPAAQRATYSPDDASSAENRTGDPMNLTSSAKETPIPPGTRTVTTTNSDFRAQTVSPLTSNDLDSDATIDMEVDDVQNHSTSTSTPIASKVKSIPVRVQDLENQFFGEEYRGTPLLQRLKTLEETVYGEGGGNRNQLGMLGRLKKLESLVFGTA